MAIDPTVLRFLMAGALNTLFGFGVYGACVLVGAATWLALLASMLAGIAFNFLTLGGYAFRDLSIRRLPRFAMGYGACYAVNLAAIHALGTAVADPLWRQAILTPPMALMSYLMMSRFVFKRTMNR